MTATTDPAPRHLVTVWNPSYGADVIESHIMLLRERARRFRQGDEEEENVYVWWGKIRSSHRQQALSHIGEILALENELGEAEGDAKRELQLYLTDYRSLYVAHVGGITASDVREDDDDPTAHIPSVYMRKDINCDCWFELWDIRRLVSDDTLAVVDELGKLHNTAYHDMPVSIYGGMVNLPLIVTRPDGARYFEADVREQLIGKQYWVEFDSEHSGIGATEREMREHCFGEDAWAKLDPGARTFIATAEKLYRDHRNDIAFDFSPILIDFAKAFEVQANILLKRALAKVRPLDRTVNIGGKSVDLVRGGPYSLGELELIIGENEHINKTLKRSITQGGEWFCSSLPPILRRLAELRNPAAHSGSLDRETVHKQRNQYLGVGCEGDLVKLAKVQVN
ncbi:MAG: hypothetical protein M3O61_10350 [Gemmatimonadota bacterium]|nr:hypothetical protein [Gemmatimonadota bacterium]